MITVLIITYKASTYYQSASVYKEEKFFYQPFTQEYENNFKKTKTENQLQEHEQSIGRPEVIQENRTYDKQQPYSRLPLLANFNCLKSIFEYNLKHL